MNTETQDWHESSYQQVADEEAVVIGWAFTHRNRTARKLQMRINEAYPSKWLKAADLQGKTVTVKVHSVTMEQFMDGSSKPALWFKGREKALILNKTNAMTLSSVYGDDTDNWTGKPVELYSQIVQGPNGMVEGLRVRVPEQAQPAPAVQTTPDDLDDDIPF